jgi:hypothetical protein
MNKDSVIGIIKKYPIAVLGFAVFFAVAVVILVRGDLTTELEAQEIDLNSRLNVLEANAKNAIGLESDVEQLQEYVGVINSKLFKLDQRAINTDFFYSLEKNMPVRINGVNPLNGNDPTLVKKAPNEIKLYDHIMYDLAIEGKYEQIIEFLKGIRDVDAFIRITAFQMTPAGNQSRTGASYLARIRVVVLAQKGT